MTPEFVLDVKGLAVGYRGKALIRDIRFTLPRGSILTLIGPNGAGKSTILKTITRQLAKIAGTAALDGRELTVLCNWTDKTVPCALASAETGEELISNYPEHKEGFLYPYEARVMLK